MLRKIFCWLTICLLVFFEFDKNALAVTPLVQAASNNYLCKAELSISPTFKTSIEFPYFSPGRIEHLYIKFSNPSSKNWDAIYSAGTDAGYWTTPVLRDISRGTSPLVIDLEPGAQPPVAGLGASFDGKNYPVKCALVQQ
jgi:hypothetical protein